MDHRPSSLPDSYRPQLTKLRRNELLRLFVERKVLLACPGDDLAEVRAVALKHIFSQWDEGGNLEQMVGRVVLSTAYTTSFLTKRMEAGTLSLRAKAAPAIDSKSAGVVVLPGEIVVSRSQPPEVDLETTERPLSVYSTGQHKKVTRVEATFDGVPIEPDFATANQPTEIGRQELEDVEVAEPSPLAGASLATDTMTEVEGPSVTSDSPDFGHAGWAATWTGVLVLLHRAMAAVHDGVFASWQWIRTLRLRSVATIVIILVAAGTSVGAAAYGLGSHPSPSGGSHPAAAHLASNAEGNAGAVPSHTASLPAASSTPNALPPSVASAAPLSSHEIFAFAPYWSLSQSSSFDVNDMTTLAYFSIGVNADGSLDTSGAGWNGYQSQALTDLINRAHAASDRVVLTVSCFDQATLDALTSSSTAAATLSKGIVAAIAAKNLDGVNIDFEGEGSADQSGLTRLVSAVSAAVHGANAHYQVTMDTYASSAGDPDGFYNISALSPAVDGFFVMAYQLNLQATASSASPLTSAMFSDLTTLTQYVKAAPQSKIILGVPYYGYDWPTTDGTLNATATGGPTTPSEATIAGAGHPIYWDPTTDTAWTSYEVGSQWHEAFFDDPTALYQVAQMAQIFGVAGLGVWALGDDGANSGLLDALRGYAPVEKLSGDGPSSTSTSASTAPVPVALPPATTSTTTALSATQAVISVPTTTPQSSTTTSTTSPGATTTTTKGTTSSFTYKAEFQGSSITMTPLAKGSSVPTGTLTLVGLTDSFSTTDPSYACLTQEKGLSIYELDGEASDEYLVAQSPTDCMAASFTVTKPPKSHSRSA
jgi:Glycosyl hydrolases family 18